MFLSIRQQSQKPQQSPVIMIASLLLIVVNSVSLSYASYNYKVCSNNFQRDCSLQMSIKEIGSCRVYNTSECQSFDFSSWVSGDPLVRPVSQDTASFEISVVPFVHAYFKDLHVSAINVTLSSKQEGVKGFAMHIIDSSQAKNDNICRIFDLSHSTEAIVKPVSLYHDHLSCMVESLLQRVKLVFRIYPANEELDYQLYIPDRESIVPVSACRWKPSILLFLGGLSLGNVELKFSTAPKHLNISRYFVTLTSIAHTRDEIIFVDDNSSKVMLEVKFPFADDGYYRISVGPVVNSTMSLQQCPGGSTTVFRISSQRVGSLIIVYIAGIVLLGIALVISALFFLGRFFKPKIPTTKPLILLVYSHDCTQHENVIRSFIILLEKRCNVDVVTLYGNSGDPQTWVQNHYSQADIVMIVVSAGLFHAVEKSNNPPLKEGHKWRRQLPASLTFIQKEMFYSKNTKKFCKVCFSYSTESHVPKCFGLRAWGGLYSLPKDMNKLLRFISGAGPKLECLGVFPRGCDLESCPEGETLMKNVKEMCCVVKRGKHIHFEDMKLPRVMFSNNEMECGADNEKDSIYSFKGRDASGKLNENDFWYFCFSSDSFKTKDYSGKSSLNEVPDAKCSSIDENEHFWLTV